MVVHDCVLGENPLNHAYGGIRPGGGYKSNTEYEIGFQLIAEATHCILGSLVKIQNSRLGMQWADVETEHITEEMSLILRYQEEYSQSMYNSPRLFSGEYAEKSKDSILYNSMRLHEQAKCYLDGLKAHKSEIYPEIYPIAVKCYELLIALSKSGALWIEGNELNALGMKSVVDSVEALRKEVEKYLTR